MHPKAALYQSILLSMVFSLLGVTLALAASGGLDRTFSSDGKVVTHMPYPITFAEDVVIQSDGKILIAGGDAAMGQSRAAIDLVRYNQNGSLDSTFDGDGIVQTTVLPDGSRDGANAVGLQSDGRILAAGYSCTSRWGCNFVMVGYKPNGALDPTFSGDGKVILRGSNPAEALAIQPDDKIVAVGSLRGGVDPDFGIYRFLPDGALDTSFSGDGKLRIPFGRYDELRDVEIQGDGKILVLGRSCDGGDCSHVVLRLNPNGTLDTTFGNQGKRILPGIMIDLALQPDGKLVFTGQTGVRIAVWRYTSAGSPDTTFNGTGKKIIPADNGREVLVQPDGKILVGGYVNANFLVVRLNPNGSLDTTFNGTGRKQIDFTGSEPGSGDRCMAIARQPADGKYVLAGYVYGNDFSYFAAARVLP